MRDVPPDEKLPVESSPSMDWPQVLDFLRSLGLAFHNISLYGVHHRGARQSLDDTHAALARILERCASLDVSVSADGVLLVDGRPVELNTPPILAMTKKLQVLETGGFTIVRGMNRDELARFLELMAAPPSMIQSVGGTLTALLQQSSLQHVRTQNVSYQRITGDQKVVDQNAPEKTADQPAAGPSLSVGEIIAFLKGETSGATEKLPEEIRDLLSDTDRLGALILQAAEIRAGQIPDAAGESLGELVVGCIRRLNQAAREAPSAQSSTGKKDLMKSLVLLEQSVLEKLRAAAGDEAVQTMAAEVSEAVGDLVEDLRVDALAVEYLKKRQLTEDCERRLVRYIKARRGKEEYAHVLEDLKQRLVDDGLDRKGWEELLAKSAAAGPLSGEGGGGGAIGSQLLSVLLIQLTEMLDPARHAVGQGATAGELAPVVTRLKHEMTASIGGTEQKSEQLNDAIQKIKKLAEHPNAEELLQHILSREQILALLAEIVQELRQPLTVINATTEMIAQGLLGGVTNVQREMLDMTLDCGRRIEGIINKLATVSGLPKTVHPDIHILDNLYQAHPMVPPH